MTKRTELLRRGAPILIVALAAALRLCGLGAESLWFDEGWSALIAKADWPLLRSVLASQPFPLYYALLNLWARLGHSEFALRLLSALAGIASVVLLYALVARTTTEGAARWAALMLAISPLNVWYSQEARMYSLATLLGLASTWALLYMLERPRTARWLIYAAASALALYCFYYTGFLFLCHGLYLGYRWWRERLGASTERNADAHTFLLAWARSMALAAVLFLPGALVLLGQLSGGTWGWVGAKYGRPGISDLLETAIAFSVGPTWHGSGAARWAVLATFGFVLVAAIARLRWDRVQIELRFGSAQGAWLWLLCLIAPIGAIFVASQLVPGFLPRYLAMFLPAYCALLGIGLDRLRPWPIKTIAALVLIAITVPSLWALHSQAQKEDWRGLVEQISAQKLPGDQVLLVDEDASAVFTYYAGEELPLTGVSGAVSDPAAIAGILASLPQGTERIWLITSHTTNRVLEEQLESSNAYALQETWRFAGADLALFRRVR